MKKALITGITGQDGSYLAELLLGKGYEVIGLLRRRSSPSLSRVQDLVEAKRIKIVEADLCDEVSLRRVIQTVRPDEIYNLAAMSHVQSSFAMPKYTMDVNGVGVLRLLEAVREFCPFSRFYQASTSELFGKVQGSHQDETTPFHPRSPYGISKLYAFWTVVNYREAYGLFACNGILFNHESPRRGEMFVSRKISLAVSRIAKGEQERLYLGNLEARRDWGYAKDFVDGMWRMLQLPKAEDIVLATGHVYTVRDFVKRAFLEVGIEIAFEGEGLEEKGRDTKTGRVLVEVREEFFRPAEVDFLLGNSAKAKALLGWEPSLSFEELVALMVRSDLGSYEA